ncbi:hypothetical protein FH972_017423 [Carpinus fangiana]|uniref:ADF-H domain-containing protein n=1 Tax=Carpinus fangiana TaxID=176857 RepID=A0A5N6RJ54_9ROSI|nr:hypothetical protein FH972_017423 [Carpinus fangiana]
MFTLRIAISVRIVDLLPLANGSATRLLRKCKRIRRPIFYCWNCPFPHGSVDFFFFVFWELKRMDQANAASGMAVHDECKLKFLELKAKRTYRFIVFKIEEKQKQVIVEKVGEPAQSYEDFTASLPADECRYAVYDFDFVTEENCQKSRIFFIAWCPDTSRVRSKMIYASSKDRFKRELDGIQIELQATDPTEMGLDVIKSRAT